MDPKHVLAVDLGGTKVRVARVDRSGKIKATLQEKSDFSQGPKGLLTQLVKLLTEVAGGESPEAVGIGSAGPLDPARGLLLSPTNFRTKGKPWGVVRLAEALEDALTVPVVLENDAAAAALGEAWAGASKKYDNSLVMTLGTGLGVGVIANGQLLRAGRGLHPEAGHIFLHAGDREALCGCGNYGCAEAYLSGAHFEKRSAKKAKQPRGARAIRDGRGIEDDYARHLALAIHTYVVCFAPEVVVVTGGFAKTASKYFTKVKKELASLLERRRVGVDLMPKLVLSKLGENAVILGAAGIAWHANDES